MTNALKQIQFSTDLEKPSLITLIKKNRVVSHDVLLLYDPKLIFSEVDQYFTDSGVTSVLR